ncbi:MAG: hypothetical protein JSS66_06170 [Armatimonadetes bacterium]|nr:hypothetical protein [Armatimonadota bacterium]
MAIKTLQDIVARLRGPKSAAKQLDGCEIKLATSLCSNVLCLEEQLRWGKLPDVVRAARYSDVTLQASYQTNGLVSHPLVLAKASRSQDAMAGYWWCEHFELFPPRVLKFMYHVARPVGSDSMLDSFMEESV